MGSLRKSASAKRIKINNNYNPPSVCSCWATLLTLAYHSCIPIFLWGGLRGGENTRPQHCGAGLIPEPGVTYGFSLLLVLVLAPRVFLTNIQNPNSTWKRWKRSGMCTAKLLLSLSLLLLLLLLLPFVAFFIAISDSINATSKQNLQSFPPPPSR